MIPGLPGMTTITVSCTFFRGNIFETTVGNPCTTVICFTSVAVPAAMLDFGSRLGKLGTTTETLCPGRGECPIFYYRIRVICNTTRTHQCWFSEVEKYENFWFVNCYKIRLVQSLPLPFPPPLRDQNDYCWPFGSRYLLRNHCGAKTWRRDCFHHFARSGDCLFCLWYLLLYLRLETKEGHRKQRFRKPNVTHPENECI